MAKRKLNSMPEGRWDEVMERDGYRCQAAAYGVTSACDGRLIVHHRKMRGAGGTSDPAIHDMDNLVVLCGGPTGRDAHHGFVHDNPRLAYDSGLLIRRN